MVIMASGIARGYVHTTVTTMATESRNMVAILQIMGWQRHAALVYCVLLWYWTSMLWTIDTCQNKVSADQYHVTISWTQVYSSSKSSIFWSWPLTKCWFFDWIVGSCLQVNLLKTVQDRRKPVNANPGLKVNWVITFSSIQMFLLLCFVYMVIIETQNRRPNNIQKTSMPSYKTQIKILLLIGLWTARPRSYAFRPA